MTNAVTVASDGLVRSSSSGTSIPPVFRNVGNMPMPQNHA